MPRWLPNLLSLLLVIGIPPFLVLSNLYVFMTPQYLDYEYGKSDFPKAQRFNDKDRRYYAAESIEYVRGNRTFEQFKALGVYNDREIKHMVDVRVLTDRVKVFHALDGIVLLIALVGLVVVGRAASPTGAARGLLNGAVLTIALFGLIGLFAAGLFNVFFVLFHRVFFEGDTWLFYTTDSLIQFYPTKFWFDTAIALAGVTIVEAVIVGAIGWGWKRIAGSRSQTPRSPAGQQAAGS